jgi:hypothetical protein
MTTRTNLVTNPSGETGATGYTSIPGTTGVAAITNPTTTTAFGVKAIRNTWSTASTAAGGGISYDVTVVAGTTYSFGFEHVLASIGNRVIMNVEWRTAGATISTSTGTQTQVTAATVYTLARTNMLAPATAVIARISIVTVAGTGYANWSIASYLQVDAFHANIGTTLNTYFDGDTAGGMWTGTAHASTSTFYLLLSPAAPTLTLGSTPCPNVEIYFPTLDPDAVAITVYRLADGVREVVAGALGATVAGDFVIRDFEVPPSTTATYSAEISDIAGGSVVSASANATNTVTAIWLQNPINPDESFTIELQAQSFTSNSRRPLNQSVYVMGIKRPFNQYFGTGALAGVPLEIWSRTQGQTDSMKSLGRDGQILVRTPPAFDPLPRNLYASVQDVAHGHLGFVQAGNPVVWILTVDEAEPVSRAIIKPLVTWDDWTAAFPAASFTWADVISVYGAGTWTDAVRNGP